MPTYPAFYLVNDRAVKLVLTPEGGLDALVLDWTSGAFVPDRSYFEKVSDVGVGKDVDSLSEAQFVACVAELRRPILQNLLAASIVWEATGDGEYPYRSSVGGRTLTIRVNDFPVEPFYTLIAEGDEIADLEDWPAAWIKPDQPAFALRSLRSGSAAWSQAPSQRLGPHWEYRSNHPRWAQATASFREGLYRGLQSSCSSNHRRYAGRNLMPSSANRNSCPGLGQEHTLSSPTKSGSMARPRRYGSSPDSATRRRGPRRCLVSLCASTQLRNSDARARRGGVPLTSRASDPIIQRGREFPTRLARVDHSSRLNNQRMTLALRPRDVLDPLRNHEKLPFPNSDNPISELDDHLALDHQERLVGVVVLVPNEVALELDDLELDVVQLCDDPWMPVIGDEGEFLM